MQPELSRRIDDIFVPFLKLCGWTALTIGAADVVTDKKILLDNILSEQTLEDLKSLSVLLTTASGFALNKSGDYYKECREKLNLSINGDLENVLKSALLYATDTVRNDYIKTNKIKGVRAASTHLFFDKLKERLKVTTVEDHHVEAYVMDRSFFLHKYAKSDEFSDLDISEDVVEYLSRKFPNAVTHAFLKGLKSNSKAEVVYRAVLAEMGVQQGRLTNETLQIIQADLLRLTNGNETVQAQINRIYHLLQLIQQILTKQNLDLSAQLRRLEKLFEDTSQPSLSNYARDYKHVDVRFQYHYKTGYTTFIGRKAEIDRIDTFVLPSIDVPFRWWLLTGPGGMGKSRLAQEICFRFNPFETWYAGFLDVKQLRDFSWRTWVPKHHTLIVIDYVSTRVAEVEQMLTALYERRTTFSRLSVRVLLLERDTDGTWWDTLQKSIGANAGWYADPLKLSPFETEDCWQIIEEVHSKITEERRQASKPLPRPLPNQTETLATLIKLDNQKRPLFAFFIGMALTAGKTILDWNVNQLLEHVLDEHEKKRWGENTNATALKKHERLLALATITRGLTSNDWRILKKEQIQVLPEAIDANLYHRMTGVINLSVEKRYLPLEPDILGEFFVKRVFEEILNDDNYEIETVQELILLAWRLQPFETWAFVERLLKDFPDTLFKSLFWAPFPTSFWTGQQVKEALNVALCWSRLKVNLIQPEYSFTYNTFVDVSDTYDQIERLRTESGFTDELELAVVQAQSASNIINHFNIRVYKDSIAKAEVYYNKVEQLRKEHAFADKHELAFVQAFIASNLVRYLGAHKDLLSKAEEYYKKIEKLRTEHVFVYNLELATEQALAADNMISNFGAHKELLNQAETYYSKIEQLRADPEFTDKLELAIAQAESALNLTARFGAHENLLKQAETYYSKIEQLLTKPEFAGKLELIILQARAAVNLAGFLGAHKKLLKQAETYYSKIEQLRSESTSADKLELAVMQAKAATNLIIGLGAHEDLLNQAETYYIKIEQLRKEYTFADKLELAAEQITAARSLINHLGAHKELLKQAETYYSKIEEIRTEPGFNDKLKLAIMQAQSAKSLISHLGTHKDLLKQAETYHDKIEQLREEPGFADKLELAVEQVIAASNLTAYFGLHGSFLKQIEIYYSKIDQLRREPTFTNNLELVCWQATVGNNLIANFITSKDLLDQAEVYYQKINILVNDYWESISVNDYWQPIMIRLLSRSTRALLEGYHFHLYNETIEREIASKQINNLYCVAGRLYEIGKQSNDPFPQIEFGVIIFKLITKPVGPYTPDLLQNWIQTLDNLSCDFADFPDDTWQQSWLPEFNQYLDRVVDVLKRAQQADNEN